MKATAGMHVTMRSNDDLVDWSECAAYYGILKIQSDQTIDLMVVYMKIRKKNSNDYDDERPNELNDGSTASTTSSMEYEAHRSE